MAALPRGNRGCGQVRRMSDLRGVGFAPLTPVAVTKGTTRAGGEPPGRCFAQCWPSLCNVVSRSLPVAVPLPARLGPQFPPGIRSPWR